MDFRSLPDRPDHPRYVRRIREIEGLLRDRKDRLVEEGMVLDKATAADDFLYFCKRFTSYDRFKIEESGHPFAGGLWIDHPWCFWLARTYQELLVEPVDGWVWIKAHRYSMKTTLGLALCLWVHSIDDTNGGYHRNLGLDRTIGLWTHKVDEIGTGMGSGLLAELQTEKLRDHYPQFRNLKVGTKLGYVVDRPAGAREQSLVVQSILTAAESKHPHLYIFDDIVTKDLRGNVEQISKIGRNLSDIAALMTPDAPVLVLNTPKDKADPLIARERDGLFARVISQAATMGGQFTPVGEPNLHTMSYYRHQRKLIHADDIYFAEFELEFRERTGTLFSWSWMRLYDQHPEEIAAASPFIHIVVDGAGGKKGSDFTVIRVVAWTAHNAWANLELIRERVGASKAMQILLGWDRSDPTAEWIERGSLAEADKGRAPYCPAGVGLIEKWRRYDKQLVLWIDDTAGWVDQFRENMRLRKIEMPQLQVRAWPQPHITRRGQQARGPRPEGFSKYAKIQMLEPIYQQGLVAYPRAGFGHGSYSGVGDSYDQREVAQQFREDEFERCQIGVPLPYDDMLDTEALLALPAARTLMRRPAEGNGYQYGGLVYPAPTIDNPYGLPGQRHAIMASMEDGRTWVSI